MQVLGWYLSFFTPSANYKALNTLFNVILDNCVIFSQYVENYLVKLLALNK
jgi:hypothetical protein